MATGAVRLRPSTVDRFTSAAGRKYRAERRVVVLALAIGVGVALHRLSPAREASWFRPSEALARGRREYDVALNKLGDFWLALVLGLAPAAASGAPLLQASRFWLSCCVLLVAGPRWRCQRRYYAQSFPRGFSANFSAWKPCSLAQPRGFLAPDFRSRRRALHGHRDDDAVGIMVGSFAKPS